MDNIKNNQYYISKIITDISFVIEHTKDLTQLEIENNEILVDSVMFRLIQISENSDKLTDEFKCCHSFVPWRAIKGMRNRIVHEYGEVDLYIVHQTITRDIPDLCSLIESILF